MNYVAHRGDLDDKNINYEDMSNFESIQSVLKIKECKNFRVILKYLNKIFWIFMKI